MKEMTHNKNIILGGSVKKTLFVVAIASMLLFSLASSAFAVNHAGQQRLGAASAYTTAAGNPLPLTGGQSAPVGGGSAPIVAGAGTYTYQDWSTGYAGNALDNSPHGLYTTSTTKCVVCHAIHYAAPGGATVASGLQTADTLLRMKASQACGYCHATTGTSVNGRPVYDGNISAGSGGSANTGHAIGTNCNECHTNVHAAGADNSVASLAGYLLKNQTTTALNGTVSTNMIGAIGSVDALAVTQGFTSGDALGGTPAVYGNTNTTTLKEQAVGVFCAECHNGAYATVGAGATTNIAGANVAGAAYSGHRIAAAATSNWNATGTGAAGAMSSSAFTGTIAWAAATNCKSCHDSTDTYGNVAFPHSWGGTKMWLMTAANAAGPKTALPYGTAVGSGYSVGNTQPQLTDGVCLKCHVASGNTAGVGINF
jgi:hypothetical protein